MWRIFKKKYKTNWEKEYDLLYEYTERVEKNLQESIEMNKKLVELLERKDGNPEIHEPIQES